MDLNDSEDAYNKVYADEPHHKKSWTHELVAAAAGFAAMKVYEDRCRDSGEKVSHGKMKELLAAIAAAEVDKLVETKGLDFLDREKMKRQASHQAHALAKEKYGEGQVGPGSGQGYDNSYGQKNDDDYGRRNDNNYERRNDDDYERRDDNDYGQRNDNSYRRKDDEDYEQRDENNYGRRDDDNY